ncbi:MAG: hypothetical protein ACK6CE_08405 [Planctomycetota bacterium]
MSRKRSRLSSGQLRRRPQGRNPSPPNFQQLEPRRLLAFLMAELQANPDDIKPIAIAVAQVEAEEVLEETVAAETTESAELVAPSEPQPPGQSDLSNEGGPGGSEPVDEPSNASVPNEPQSPTPPAGGSDQPLAEEGNVEEEVVDEQPSLQPAEPDGESPSAEQPSEEPAPTAGEFTQPGGVSIPGSPEASLPSGSDATNSAADETAPPDGSTQAPHENGSSSQASDSQGASDVSPALPSEGGVNPSQPSDQSESSETGSDQTDAGEQPGQQLPGHADVTPPPASQETTPVEQSGAGETGPEDANSADQADDAEQESTKDPAADRSETEEPSQAADGSGPTAVSRDEARTTDSAPVDSAAENAANDEGETGSGVSEAREFGAARGGAVETTPFALEDATNRAELFGLLWYIEETDSSCLIDEDVAPRAELPFGEFGFQLSVDRGSLLEFLELMEGPVVNSGKNQRGQVSLEVSTLNPAFVHQLNLGWE